jgi:UV excision repair protein RAD23
MVSNLTDMGFPKDEVVRALRAAFNNPDRAVEYLTTGIPDVPAPAPAQPASPSQQTGGAPSLNPSSPLIPPQFLQQQQQQPQQQQRAPGVFDFLRHHPQFGLLRQMVQANPQLLQPVLQQLGEQNPQILQLINQHQQEFIQLINEPVEGGGPMPGMPQGAPPGAQYIQVTQEEKAAIDRLEALGFDRSVVIEAFFACDKDESLAANYLLEHLGEEEDDLQQ